MEPEIMIKVEYELLSNDVVLIKINNHSFSVEKEDLVDLIELCVKAGEALIRAQAKKYNTSFLRDEDWN